MAHRNWTSGTLSSDDGWRQDVERKATAHHEAGHAVIRLHLDLPLKSVDIIRGGGDLGGCNGRPPPAAVEREMDSIAAARDLGRAVDVETITPATKTWIENFIRSTQAGPLAEARFRGRKLSTHDPGIRQDLDAIEFFARLRWDAAERARRLQRSEGEVNRLLEEPGVWRAVTAVARALLEREALTGDESYELYRAAMRT